MRWGTLPGLGITQFARFIIMEHTYIGLNFIFDIAFSGSCWSSPSDSEMLGVASWSVSFFVGACTRLRYVYMCSYMIDYSHECLYLYHIVKKRVYICTMLWRKRMNTYSTISVCIYKTRGTSSKAKAFAYMISGRHGIIIRANCAGVVCSHLHV